MSKVILSVGDMKIANDDLIGRIILNYLHLMIFWMKVIESSQCFKISDVATFAKYVCLIYSTLKQHSNISDTML